MMKKNQKVFLPDVILLIRLVMVSLPIWVASFALADYGTGIVKCSAHDERDFAFAKKYDIPLKSGACFLKIARASRTSSKF